MHFYSADVLYGGRDGVFQFTNTASISTRTADGVVSAPTMFNDPYSTLERALRNCERTLSLIFLESSPTLLLPTSRFNVPRFAHRIPSIHNSNCPCRLPSSPSTFPFSFPASIIHHPSHLIPSLNLTTHPCRTSSLKASTKMAPFSLTSRQPTMPLTTRLSPPSPRPPASSASPSPPRKSPPA